MSSAGGRVGVATSRSIPGIRTPAQCPAGQLGNGLDVITAGKTTAGKRASWEIDAPPGFSIVGAHTVGSQGMVSYGVNSGKGWGGGFYWRGGGAQVSAGETNYSSPLINSPYFGWQVVCGASTCDGSTKPGEIAVLELEIAGAESSGPTVSVAPGSLGAAGGWARGTWPVAFSADGPSGACQLAASFGGASVSQPLNEPQSQTRWHQCSAGLVLSVVQHRGDRVGSSCAAGDVGARCRLRLQRWALSVRHRHKVREYRQRTGERQLVRSDGCALDCGYAIRDGHGLGWPVRRVRHRVLGRRCPISVVCAGERADPGCGGRCSSGDLLQRQQRERCVRSRRDVGA